MSKRKRRQPKLQISQIIAGVVVFSALALGGWAVAQQFAPRTGTTLRDTETAFSIPTHVGEPAPEFTAIGADGQPYTFTPGNGRPKAIVFYMGFR